MIDVTLTEDVRHYELKVGRKLVGRVTVWSADYIVGEVWNSEISGWEEIDNYPSLRHAANAVRKSGYGNAPGITLAPFRGVRTR